MRNTARKLWSLSSLASMALGGALLAAVPSAVQAQETAEDEGIKVNAVIETNYTHNFNRPSTNNNTFLYNNREGQLGLNLAQITLSKAATPTSRAGFTLRLVEGEVRKFSFIPDDDSIILEAYGTFLAPLGDRNPCFRNASSTANLPGAPGRSGPEGGCGPVRDARRLRDHRHRHQ